MYILSFIGTTFFFKKVKKILPFFFKGKIIEILIFGHIFAIIYVRVHNIQIIRFRIYNSNISFSSQLNLKFYIS